MSDKLTFLNFDILKIFSYAHKQRNLILRELSEMIRYSYKVFLNMRLVCESKTMKTFLTLQML